MDFKDELKNYAKITENELKKYIRKNDCLEKKLNDSVEYSLMAGGKRLRPTLILATYELFKEDNKICMPYVVAIEMIHNFSLIHDDLPGIDNDDFRHGKPTNHKMFNEATAILAGDSLLNNAYLVISENLKNNLTQENIDCFYELSYAVDRMLIGEYVDTEYEGNQALIDELEYMHKNKTGALIRATVRIGAILAKVNEKDLANLTNYAEKIGLAFQIRDDILSEIGDEKVLGKPVGNDRKRNKCTYVSKYGLEKAEQELEKNIKEAINCLEPYGEKAEFLKDLAIYIGERNK